MVDLFASVLTLNGVGETRAKLLAKLGIVTLYDLLSHFPRAYEDRTRLVPICELEADTPACFRAMIASEPRSALTRKNQWRTSVSVWDDTGRLQLVFFNQRYLQERLTYGKEYVFYGTMSGDYAGYSMANPQFEPVDSPGVTTRRIMPIYPLCAGLTNALLVKTIGQALDACLDKLPELLPEALRARYALCDVKTAYRGIHTPADFDELERARRRLVFEEFFILSTGLRLLRSQRTVHDKEPFHECSLSDFTAALPFCLTAAQQRAIRDIVSDFQKPTAMNRVLQGDVGSGKTVVAAAAAFCAARNGVQTALMAPTEILAEQHARSLEPLLAPLGVRCVLLTGSMTPAQKKSARVAICAHEKDLIIGTHALLSEATVFDKLGLVIADEQHRFGVAQRAALAQKGSKPHLLVMSATPIPRTLALIAYGDLDISILDELPPGRQTIDTFLVDESKRQRVNDFIRKQVEQGHQCYIVCPAVEESELETLKSAEVWAQTLQEQVFQNLRVALLHGKMRGAEKEARMRDFAAGRVDILVATTVIEVGVDVPNATLMVVENADRFGLSQLHQLRGRVGRGKSKSYCILISSNRSQLAQTRLRALCKTCDGFKIAEEDLSARGPGDFFGQRQHGLPLFKVGSLQLDMSVLHDAQAAADEFLRQPEPEQSEQYAPLLQRIHALFEEKDGTLN